MAELQIGHRKSCLVLSVCFPVVNWRSRPDAKSAYYFSSRGDRSCLSPCLLETTKTPTLIGQWLGGGVIPLVVVLQKECQTKYSKHPCIRTHDVGVQADLFLIINKQLSKILKTPRQLLLIVNLWLSSSNHSDIAFLFRHPLPYYIRTCFIYISGWTGSYIYIYMVPYGPNFSLIFLIHLLLHAGVYSIQWFWRRL